MTTDTPTKAKRRPRFGRPAKEPTVHITERDLAILATHVQHRFLRSDQCARLFPDASPKKIIERIGQLNAAGYLDRPPSQVEHYRAGGGSTAIIHAIGNRGAQLLAEQAHVNPGRLAWTRKNHKATRAFIHHSIAVADIAIAFEVAARRHGGVTLLQMPDLLATLPEATREADNSLKITTELFHAGQRITAGVIPDLALQLSFADGSRRAFLIEVDRGRMPVERAQLGQTSILKKALIYDAARTRQQIQKQFGWKACRVLIISDVISLPRFVDPKTTGNPYPTAPRPKPDHNGAMQRASNIRAAIANSPTLAKSPLFLVADKPSLDAAPSILTFPWLAPDGSTHRLVP